MQVTAHKRRKAAAKPTIKPASDHLLERIRETLLLFGGEAHRRDVIANVARETGFDVKNIPQDFEAAVILSFEETVRDEVRRAAHGFYLKFGEGSHRWSVKLPETAH
ncbi:hypothetical protein M9M90_17125 [Phenylobacterium sp. LH3H17]|uniref:hypothetical protein n=1 Tax=Phenylobacterium sp. LH3H17 TaxID=2903901 RepID=UPI0020C9F991|nr:hypothetical protein [Phenylobacterium sp. LH3H17]UTP38926.1 hypothetical protein M9M90_17125 [Phenylobacterium sp. LH3H17]